MTGKRAKTDRAVAPRLAVFVVIALLCPVVPVAGAADSTGGLQIEQVTVGIGGRYKVGRWTPVTVRLRADRAYDPLTIELESSDPYGHRTVLPRQFSLPAAGRFSRTALFKPGRLKPRLRVRVKSEDGTEQTARTLPVAEGEAAGLRPALTQDAVLIAAIGAPAGLQALAEANDRMHLVRPDDAGGLPSDARALDGLDILFVNGPASMTAAQSRAVREWVGSGGHLVTSAGGGTDEYRKSALGQWLQEVVPIAGTTPVRELGGLESYSGKSQRVPMPVGGVEVAEISPEFEGTALVREFHGPLIVRAAAGFGRVTFAGIDLAEPALAEWEPYTDVLKKLLATTREDRSDGESTQQGRLSHSGVSELATQLHVALSGRSGSGRYRLWSAMGFLLLYLAVIGPVDYFLVRRLFARPQLTWLTFPLIVAAAASLAAWTAVQTRESQVQASQIDLIDIDGRVGESGLQSARLRSWFNVSSPESRRYRVSASTAAGFPSSTRRAGSDAGRASGDEPLPLRLTWAGVPEDSFGGMYREGGVEFGRPAYSFLADAVGVRDLPISIESARTLTAEGQRRIAAVVESDLQHAGIGRVSGTLVHRLPGPIEDWMLAYGPRVYYPAVDPRSGAPAVIEPEVPFSPTGRLVRARELQGFLTGRRQIVSAGKTRVQQPKYRLVQTEYDPLARDPHRILQMMTFHNSAGGTSYTGLQNSALRRLEFSPLLEAGRAVLFGRIPPATARLQMDGRPVEPRRRWTFVRIVLPVGR